MLKKLKVKKHFEKLERRKCEAGFSLIEVIAVTIIIGVMATMLIPSINGVGAKARNTKLKNDLATLDQAIATYKLEQGSVPESLNNLIPDYIGQNLCNPTSSQTPCLSVLQRYSCMNNVTIVRC